MEERYFGVLGALRVTGATGEPIAFTGTTQRRLVTALVSRVGGVASADWLCDLLEVSPGALRTAVSRLRGVLGYDVLETEAPGYCLCTDRVDTLTFENLFEHAAATSDRTEAMRLLGDALSLWRGAAYEEFAFEEWARVEATRLEELRAGATEDLVELETATGHHSDAIARATTLTTEHPFRDRPRALLMAALDAAGRRTEALRAYQDYRTLLVEEVGTEPSDEVKAIEQAIATGTGPHRESPVRPRSSSAVSSSLPVQRTALFGRESELDDVASLVRNQRLVTVVGPGGVGKTRVAVESARRISGDFDDGVLFVDLTQVEPGGSVEGAFSSVLGRGVPPGRTHREHLTAELDGRSCLLVVDNCEHLLEHVAPLVDHLLGAAPSVRVLATSRVVLGVRGEHVMKLAPLPAGDPGSPAVEVFVERARARHDWLEFDTSQLATITEVVGRLDGLPLAIELASAHAGALTPAQILDLLDDRFRLLVGTPHDDPRHRTLETTIEWSYELLEPDEQRMLRMLSLCAGAVTLLTVQRLTGGDRIYAVSLVERLLDRSILHLSTTGRTEQGYRMLESLREFGRRELDESGESDTAAVALERALLPPPEAIDDFNSFVTESIDWNERPAIEVMTRRIAAERAHESGRHDSAALLYATATSPDQPGVHEEMLERIRAWQAESSALSSSALHALRLSEVLLETFTLRLTEMLDTASSTLAEMDPHDPARDVFEAWQLMAFTVVDPESVVAQTESLPAGSVSRDPPDFALAMRTAARSIALLAAERIEDAHVAARSATGWAAPGSGSFDMAGSHLLWMEHTEGLERSVEADRTLESTEIRHLSNRLAVAAAVGSAEPIAQRAAKVCRLATSGSRRGTLYEESIYIAAFAWLAFEAGDIDRADALLERFVSADPATGTAAVRAMDRISRERTGEPITRDELLERMFAPDVHQVMPRLLPKLLAQELSRWGDHDQGRSLSGSPGVA